MKGTPKNIWHVGNFVVFGLSSSRLVLVTITFFCMALKLMASNQDGSTS